MKWNKKTAAAVLAGVLFVSFVPFFARSVGSGERSQQTKRKAVENEPEEESGSGPAAAVDLGVRTITGTFRDPIAVSDVSWEAEFGWEYLLSDRYRSTEYNKELAGVSLVLSASLDDSYECIRKVLEEGGSSGLGCTAGEMVYEESSPAMAIANVKSADADQAPVCAVIVVLRGTNSPKDGLNDLLSASGLKDWGAGRVTESVKNYVAEHCAAASNIRFLITGHSLGGACADIVAKNLSDDFGKEHVFAYTFAAPSPLQEPASGDYDNIFNFLCEQDNVPLHLSIRNSWTGYGRYRWFSYEEGEEPGASYQALTGKTWETTYRDTYKRIMGIRTVPLHLHASSAYLAYVQCDPEAFE